MRSGLLPILLLVVGLALFFEYLIGGKLFLFTDIGSDTSIIYFPDLYYLASYIRETGFPSWSHTQGLGQDILPFYLGDPTNWLLLAAGPTKLHSLLPWVVLLRLLLAGFFFGRFLRLLGFAKFSVVVGGLAFAYSGFGVLGSTWYIFATEHWQFAGLLYSYELLRQSVLKKGQSYKGLLSSARLLSSVGSAGSSLKALLFPLMIALIALHQPFNLYLFGVLLLIYLLFREGMVFGLGGGGLRGFSNWFSLRTIMLQMIGYSILGLAMAAVLAFPQIKELLSSPRGSGMAGSGLMNQVVFSPAPLIQIKSFVARLFGNDLYSSGYHFMGWQNYLESPATYVGLALLLFFPQGLASLSKRKRYWTLALTLFLSLLLFFPFFRHALWLFSGDYFRATNYLFALPILLAGLWGAEQIFLRKKLKLRLLLACLFLFGGLACIDLHQFPGVLQRRIQLLIVSLLLANSLLAIWANRSHRFTPKLFLLLFAIELVLIGRPTLHDRTTVGPENFFTKGYFDESYAKVQTLYDENERFFRLSKAQLATFTDNLSLNDAKVQGYFGACSYRSFNHTSYVRFLDGMKVIDASKEFDTRWIGGLGNRPYLKALLGFRYYLTAENTVELAELAMPLGVFYTHSYPLSSLDSLSENRIDTLIWKGAFLSAKDAQLLKPAAVQAIGIESELEGEQDWFLSQRQHLLDGSFDPVEWGQNFFIGKSSPSQDGLLCFSIPYDNGWKVYVDGEKRASELVEVQAGLSGVFLTAGSHDLRLEYHNASLRWGAIVSCLALLLYILLAIIFKKKAS